MVTNDSLGTVHTANLDDIRDTPRPEIRHAYKLLDSISYMPRNIHVPALPNGTIDQTVARWALEPRSELTQKAYAHDIHQFFMYWHGNYRPRTWTTAKQDEIAQFLGWYRNQSPSTHASATARGRSPATVTRMQAALISLFRTALTRGQLVNIPVPKGPINATKGRSRNQANWLTPRAIQDWRTYGIARIADPNADRMLQIVRNQAYTDLLYGTGLRRQEAGGLLVYEIPQKQFSKNLHQGWVPGTLSKNAPFRGRAFYADRQVMNSVGSYLEQQRTLDVEAGQRSGRYEEDPLKEIVIDKAQIGTANATMTLESRTGSIRKVNLRELTLAEREHIYEQSEDGRLQPAYLWLRTNGMPLKPTAWNGIFEAANKACKKALGEASPHITPHRLRHSFALRVFAASLIATTQSTGETTKNAAQSIVDQGNIWIRLQNLLGHKSPDTTRDYYLEPVTTLEWELIIRHSEDKTIDQFFSLISAIEPRIQDRDPAGQ